MGSVEVDLQYYCTTSLLARRRPQVRLLVQHFAKRACNLIVTRHRCRPRRRFVLLYESGVQDKIRGGGGAHWLECSSTCFTSYLGFSHFSPSYLKKMKQALNENVQLSQRAPIARVLRACKEPGGDSCANSRVRCMASQG